MTVRSALASLFSSAPDLATATAPAAPLPPVDLRSPWIDPDPTHLGHVVFGDIFGQVDVDRVPMTRSQAMAVPAVRRARNILCGSIARLPVYCETATGDRRTDVAWLAKPDPAVTRVAQVAGMVDDLIFHDVSFAVVLGRGWDDRWPIGLRRVEVWRVTAPDPKVPGDRWKVDGQPIETRDLIRVDGIGGGGVLATSSATLRVAAKLESAAMRVADNPVPAVELHQESGPDLDQVEIDDLVAGWISARRKGHGVGFTSPQIRAHALGAPAEHLLLGARDHQATDVARVMGAPADMIDAPSGSSMTYANITERAEHLIDYGLANLAGAIEARWSEDDLVPHGSATRFDFDPLRRGSFADRMAGYAAAVASGAYDQAEIRSLERGRPMTRGAQ